MEEKTQKDAGSKPVQKKTVEKKPSGRKAWRVDLKWFFAILATLLLTLSLTSLAAYRASSSPQIEKLAKAPKSSQPVMGDIFSGAKNGSEFKIKLGGKEYTPQKLEKLPEAEAQKLFEQEMKNGNSDLAKLMSQGSKMKNPMQGKTPDEMMDTEALGQQMMKSVVEQAILPETGKFLSKTVKTLSMGIFVATLLGAILFLTLAVVFSHRFGRLTTFAVVLLISAAPAFKISLLFKLIGSATAGVDKAAMAASPFKALSALPQALADANLSLFSGLVAFSLLAIFFSMIFGFITRPKKKSEPKAAAPVAKAKAA